MTEDEKVKGRRHRDSGRIGLHLGRPARTAHINWRGVCIGQPGGKGGSLDYIAREGDYSDRDDLQHLAGDPDELREAMAAIEATARIRRGPSAERLAIAGVFELPVESSPAQRKALAEARVAYWRQRGHVAVVAVHDEPGNPHIHELVSARPVQRDTTGHMVVDRSVRIMVGKAAVQAERMVVADLVNNQTRPRVRFWGGRDQKMDRPGIVGRKPERRTPRAVRHGQRPDEPHQIQLARERHQEARRRAQWTKRQNRHLKCQKALQRAEKAGVLVHVTTPKVSDRTRRFLVSEAYLGEVRVESFKAGRQRGHEERPPPPPLPELTEKQAAWVTDTHQKLGLELAADWHATAEGRAAAFGVARGAGRLTELIQQSAAKTPVPPVPSRPSRGRGRE